MTFFIITMLLIVVADCFGQGDAAARLILKVSTGGILICGVTYALAELFARFAHHHRTSDAGDGTSTLEQEDEPDA